MGMLLIRERCCRLSIEERTASAVTVCLNGSAVRVCGVPAGRFSLVAETEVRGSSPRHVPVPGVAK